MTTIEVLCLDTLDLTMCNHLLIFASNVDDKLLGLFAFAEITRKALGKWLDYFTSMDVVP